MSQPEHPSAYRLGQVDAILWSATTQVQNYAQRFLAAFPTSNSEVPSIITELRITHLGALDSPQLVWGADASRAGNAYRFCAHAAAGIWCEVRIPESEAAPLAIHCFPVHSRSRRIWNVVRAKQGTQNQLAMTMIRQGLILPALAEGMIHHQTLAVHASVVATNGKAIVLTGLNGCGKSGLALHLVARQGYAYMSDNYGLLDPNAGTAIAFPEPIRIGDREREVAKDFFHGQDQAFGKLQMTPRQDLVRDIAALGCLVHISIGDRFAVAEVAGDVFARRLDCLHRFLAETPEYSWLQLYHLWHQGLDLGAMAAKLQLHLCKSLPCYEMTLPSSDAIDLRYGEAASWIRDRLGP